ncbi:glycosyltransferase [Mangrovibacterium marinum]|uniref:glycosyltransferase n=1 Tax=Mangrovibacterium marinum TaxID=1639118 RepID=UPI002A188169|nr:glycosyltransferase [Mangrovibacterium marinum]
METLSINSFLKNYCQVHLYTYEYIKNIPDEVIVMDASEIISQKKIFKYPHHDSYAGFANLFRYKLLMEKGGYWSDLDIVCLKPIPTDEMYVFASERRPNQTVCVNNCFIGVPENSEIMEYCYSSALNKKTEELHWGQTGPELLTEAVIKYGLEEYIVHPDVICPVDYWNCRNFLDNSNKNIISEDTYTIHLWNEMWRRNNMDKSALYDDNCIYEELQREYNT